MAVKRIQSLPQFEFFSFSESLEPLPGLENIIHKHWYGRQHIFIVLHDTITLVTVTEAQRYPLDMKLLVVL